MVEQISVQQFSLVAKSKNEVYRLLSSEGKASQLFPHWELLSQYPKDIYLTLLAGIYLPHKRTVNTFFLKDIACGTKKVRTSLNFPVAYQEF